MTHAAAMLSGSSARLLYEASQMKPQPKEILLFFVARTPQGQYNPLLWHANAWISSDQVSLCNRRCIQNWCCSRNHTKYHPQREQNHGWTGGKASFRGHRVIILGGNIAGPFLFVIWSSATSLLLSWFSRCSCFFCAFWHNQKILRQLDQVTNLLTAMLPKVS